MKTNSIKFNFLMNIILTVSNVLFPLITFPYIARVILPIGNGKIAFCTSVISYFTMIAMVGIPTYGIREVAKVRDDKDKLTKTVYELLLISLITTIFSLLILIILIFYIPKFNAEKQLFFINAIGIFLNTIGVNWLYSGLEQYKYITIRSLVFKILSVIAMFLLVKNPEDYIVYGAISVFATGGSNVLNFLNLRKFINVKYNGELEFRKHIKPIMVFFATVLATSIYVNLDTVMIGFINGNFEVGLYSTSLKIRSVVLSIVTALGTVLMPRLSYYVENGLYDDFKKVVAKCFNFITLLSVPLCMFIFIYSKNCIEFIAGEEYVMATMSLKIVIFTVIIVGYSNLTGIQILTPFGKENQLLKSIIYGAIVDFVLNLIFIPIFKSNGAAFATLIAELTVLIAQMIYLKDFLTTIKNLVKIKRYLFFTLIATLVTLVFKNIFVGTAFINLILGATVYFGVGLILLIASKDPFYEMGMDIIRKRMKNENKNLIIGGGISGLSYANFCNDYIIVEKEKAVGGYCRTIYSNGYVWDYAGHFFHFKTDEIKNMFLNSINKKEIVYQDKCTKILVDNDIVDYPFQTNIHQLEKSKFIDCLYDLFNKEEKEEYDNFLDMLYGKFGKSIVDMFLKPYNEKLYACDLKELDKNAMGRFFPYADKEEIINNMKKNEDVSYNNSFLYPLRGAETFIDVLYNNLDKNKIFMETEIISINKKKKIAITNTGLVIEYDNLINTIPLNHFTKLLNDVESNLLNDKLSYNQVLVFNLGFNKKSKFNKEHWLYFPDKHINFYRAGFYDNILNTDRLSMYIEIGYNKNAIIDENEINRQLDKTIESLIKVNIIDNSYKLIDYHPIVMNPAYVHINTKTDEEIKKYLSKLSEDNIYSIGRYGAWTYCSMEDCIIMAQELSAKL